MAEKKGSIGYRTPAKELEERFEGINKILTQKKTNWTELYKITKVVFDEATDIYERAKNSKEDEQIILALASYRLFFLAMGMISRVGKELTETHERLAKCEKALEELKKAV